MYRLGYRFGTKLQNAYQNPEIWQAKKRKRRRGDYKEGLIVPRKVLC
jgi:hypothetical protein